jgi:hypothetical protein
VRKKEQTKDEPEHNLHNFSDCPNVCNFGKKSKYFAEKNAKIKNLLH